MIKVFLKNNKHVEFELGVEKKEIELVMRFHYGLDGDTVLNLKTKNRESLTRIKVSEINNMQHLKNKISKEASTNVLKHDSKFKTRDEYEKWKKQKISENKLKLSGKKSNAKK